MLQTFGALENRRCELQLVKPASGIEKSANPHESGGTNFVSCAHFFYHVFDLVCAYTTKSETCFDNHNIRNMLSRSVLGLIYTPRYTKFWLFGPRLSVARCNDQFENSAH